MNVLEIEYKVYLGKYAAKNVKDYPLMRQFHVEMNGVSWPYFNESEYENLLSIASKHGYCLEVENC